MSLARALPEALLLDYATGAAGPGIGLLVATHLSMSEQSRALFAVMETIGGTLLEELDDEPLERISAAAALDMAEDGESVGVRDPWPEIPARPPVDPMIGAPASFETDQLPAPLLAAQASAGSDCRWRRLGIGVAASKLALSTERERAHLLWARGGTGIATHRHVGREVVLVLKGAFWDEDIRFGAGDVALCEDGSVHSPHTEDGEDCLCLAVTEAPVHFTGFAGFALNRFCRF